MPTIQIIRATPGPTTSERIVQLLSAHPQGMSVKELSRELNRPFSMVQHCLKPLVASQAISVRFNQDGREWLYAIAETNLVASRCLTKGRSRVIQLKC